MQSHIHARLTPFPWTFLFTFWHAISYEIDALIFILFLCRNPCVVAVRVRVRERLSWCSRTMYAFITHKIIAYDERECSECVEVVWNNKIEQILSSTSFITYVFSDSVWFVFVCLHAVVLCFVSSPFRS